MTTSTGNYTGSSSGFVLIYDEKNRIQDHWNCVSRVLDITRYVLNVIKALGTDSSEITNAIDGIRCVQILGVLSTLSDLPTRIRQIKESIQVGDIEGIILRSCLFLMQSMSVADNVIGITRAIHQLAQVTFTISSALLSTVSFGLTALSIIYRSVWSYNRRTFVHKFDTELMKGLQEGDTRQTAEKINQFTKQYFALSDKEKDAIRQVEQAKQGVKEEQKEKNIAQKEKNLLGKKKLALIRRSDWEFVTALEKVHKEGVKDDTAEAMVERLHKMRKGLNRLLTIDCCLIAAMITSLAAVILFNVPLSPALLFLPYLLLAAAAIVRLGVDVEYAYHHYYRPKFPPAQGNLT